jgi:hypothetical protein
MELQLLNDAFPMGADRIHGKEAESRILIWPVRKYFSEGGRGRHSWKMDLA